MAGPQGRQRTRDWGFRVRFCFGDGLLQDRGLPAYAMVIRIEWTLDHQVELWKVTSYLPYSPTELGAGSVR
jgi:hypothetical protein